MQFRWCTLAFAASLSAALLSTACGNGSDPSTTGATDGGATDPDATTPTPDGGGSTDAGSSDASADAPLDIEQDPNVYPAHHHPIPPVDNQGGPLLNHMEIVTVTFAGDPLRDTFRSFDHAIGTTSWWRATLGTYGIADGVTGPDVELDNAIVNSSMTDDAFKLYLKGKITGGTLTTPTAQTLYVIYAPSTLSIALPGLGNSCQGFDGYHGSFAISLTGADGGTTTVDAAYALVFDCGGGLGNMTITASHEIAEAATDPNIQDTPSYYMYTNDAWEQSLGGGQKAGEVGDLCSWLPWTEGSWEVQRIYSNGAAALSKDPCQPASARYYGAAPRTTITIVAGVRMDGRVTVRRGQTVDVVLDAFSEAALPNDFTLHVGNASGGGGLTSIGPAITSHLSRTTVHNGNGVILTLAAGANTPPGDYPFVIRSALNGSSSNDWPAILTVR